MIELLKKFNVFEGMEDGELQEIAKACSLKQFSKGAQVFRAGDPAESLFLVNKGKVELRFKATYHSVSTEISLDKVSPGDAFGWSALTYPFKYTLSAYVAEDSELVELKESDIRGICRDNAHLGYTLMNNVAKIIGQRFSTIQAILIQEIQQDLKKRESLG
jgi:signal-transduction protein with cAMP-binding, CBS, and nucleotidyltransferase domain